MVSFKQYVAESILTEQGKSEVNADVIYQKMLDVLDNAHINFPLQADAQGDAQGGGMIAFHLGKIIKNSNIDLSVAIRTEDKEAVRLARNKETQGLTIVVGTRKDLPARSEIDAFLSKNRTRAQKVKGFISEYLSDHYGNEDPSLITTKYEEESEANSSFEDRWNKLVEQLKGRVSDYNGMMGDFDDDTENVAIRETDKRAKRSLAKEQFGDTIEEFKKIALKEFGVSKMMSKENKDKLNSRLESFYDQEIRPLQAS